MVRIGRRNRLVVVGGVAAGASAAAKARRANEEIEIVLVEAGPYISFANCGLPYFMGGEIENRDRLFVTTAEKFSRRYDLEVRVETRVTGVNRHNKTIGLSRGGELSYDRLILATGTLPLRPPVPGLDAGPVFTVRTVPDVDAICEVLKTGSGQKALVVGGGYIGLEAAEQLLLRGLKVTLLEIAEQLMPSLDVEMTQPLQEALTDAGAEILLREGLSSIENRTAITSEGRKIPFDLVLLATGVRPNVELAVNAGIDLGTTGAIAVDNFQRTSDPAIFAAGDNAESMHIVLNKPVSIPLAGPANKAGRVAGANAADDLAGLKEDDPRRLTFRGVLGTAVVRVCRATAAVTGLTEREARSQRIPYTVSYFPGSSHAGYYPGAERLMLKMVYHKETGRILGAQCVGGAGVDKRIDVLSTAISAGMSVGDLEQLDLCYAPPFGSAKDPVNQIGFGGANQERGIMPALTPKELLEELSGAEPPQVIDVRTIEEYREGHIEDSLLIPLHELRDRGDDVSEDRTVVLYCRSGHRSYIGQQMLRNLGRRNVRNLLGGYTLLQQTIKALRVAR
jgi:NADPH-dependent 2,4-dienoyl-CoA reductase/sulfur reductase-like enzyme/rhodanese-related sulfurtransferase